MNDLRKVVKDQMVIFANNAMHANEKTIDNMGNKCADAILDAVIAALPEKRQAQYILEGGTTNTQEGNQRFYRYGGYDAALTNVKRIIQAAKESK